MKVMGAGDREHYSLYRVPHISTDWGQVVKWNPQEYWECLYFEYGGQVLKLCLSMQTTADPISHNFATPFASGGIGDT